MITPHGRRLMDALDALGTASPAARHRAQRHDALDTMAHRLHGLAARRRSDALARATLLCHATERAQAASVAPRPPNSKTL